jgi:hypothetical protein
MPLRSSFTDLSALKFPIGEFLRLEYPARLLSQAYSWWSGELLSLMPRRIRSALLSYLPPIYLVEWENGDISTKELPRHKGSQSDNAVKRLWNSWETAAQSLPEQTKVIIVLPPRFALIAEAQLPPTSRGALRAATILQFERHVPFRASDAYFDVHRAPGGEAGATVVSNIGVVPRRKLDPILAAMARQKLRVSRIRLRLATGMLDERFDFAWSLGKFRGFFLTRERIAALALATLLCLTAVVTVDRRWDQESSLLETAIAAGATGAADVRRLNEQIAATERREMAIREMGNAGRMLLLLDDLAQRMPDGVWLDSVALKPGEILLAGFAPDTSQIIPLIAASSYIRDVSLRGSLLPANGGRVEHFEILAIPAASNATR